MFEIAGATAMIAALIFGMIGVYFSKLYSCNALSASLDYFITARNSQPWWSVALAFLAASTGSWVLFLPAKMAGDPDYGSAGTLVLLFYAIAASYPILLIAYLGYIMKRKYPSMRSFADFVYQRFGGAAGCYANIVTIVITSIGLVTEYSALGKLFSLFKIGRHIPIILSGFITLISISSGGLHISMKINQYQMILCILLLIIVTVYVSPVLDISTVSKSTYPSHLTKHGFYVIIAMIISYQSLFMFNDGMWQRVLSSESKRALRIGSCAGAALNMVFLFTIGFMGYLAFSSGLVHDPRISFVGIFSDSPQWIVTILMVLGTCMSQGVILKVDITELFLISNILTISSVLPFLLGLVPELEDFVTGSSVLLGCAFSLFCVFLYGFFTTGYFVNGVFKVLFDEYSWEPFAIALIASLFGVGLSSMMEMGLSSCADPTRISDSKLKRHTLPYHSFQTSDISHEEDI